LRAGIVDDCPQALQAAAHGRRDNAFAAAPWRQGRGVAKTVDAASQGDAAEEDFHDQFPSSIMAPMRSCAFVVFCFLIKILLAR
jgi:hypothetical protein